MLYINSTSLASPSPELIEGKSNRKRSSENRYYIISRIIRIKGKT
jgi:hypothetical protein